jgi:crotonobetaine/carnitine-CoA ligase
MTEIGPVTHVLPSPDGKPGPNKAGAAGRVNDDQYEVRLFDDEDQEVSPGEVGEIVCRPVVPNMMFSCYWNRPDATVAAWRNLWFHTGDLGRIDSDGYLYLVDRKADYIRKRGENVSSQELEAVFRSHPDIAEVAVHAVRSELGEDDIKVTAVLAGSASTDPEGLAHWSRQRLPEHAWPRYVEFRTELPHNAVGRVLKKELREQGVTNSTWDAGDRRRKEAPA